MKGPLFVLALAAAATLSGGSAHIALAAEHRSEAQLFATNNTAIITDPNDPRLNDRLVQFGEQVTDILDDGGADAEGSTLLNGVFFDSTARPLPTSGLASSTSRTSARPGCTRSPPSSAIDSTRTPS